MNLNKRLKALEGEQRPGIKSYNVLINSYELPYLNREDGRVFFKSMDQLERFRELFKGNDNRLLMFRIIHEDNDPEPVPDDSVYVTGWDENANLTYSDNESH